MRLLFPVALLTACSPALHRPATYGPSPATLPAAAGARDPRELEERIRGLGSEIESLRSRISVLNGAIYGHEASGDPGRVSLAADARAERDRLERRRESLVSQRQGLESIHDSVVSRSTVPGR